MLFPIFRQDSPPLALATCGPSFARFTMRWRSSSASADRKAMKPRPMGVVRSRCGLSSTLTRASRAWMRSMFTNAGHECAKLAMHEFSSTAQNLDRQIGALSKRTVR